VIINPSCLYNLGDPLLVCSLPRYMHFYRPLLSCNNTPLFLPCLQNSLEHFSCIRGYIILSVAWQWIFPSLGNSAFQTTCHNILVFTLRLKRLIFRFLKALSFLPFNIWLTEWLQNWK
jgi:hypothetical protein